MPDPVNNKLSQFKAAIGYDWTLKAVEPGKGVVFDWPEPTEWGDLKGAGWKINCDTVKILPPSAARQWDLAKGSDHAEIVVFVSSAGPEPAWRRLLETATTTTMLDYPFERSPVSLGHLTIRGIAPQPCFLVWTFYNVCFRISYSNLDADATPAAKWIQKHAKQHVVDRLADHPPAIAEIDLSASTVKVGEEVTARVTPAPGLDLERLTLEVGRKREHLAWVSDEGMSLVFRGLSPGRGEVEIALVDKKNLLCTPGVVKVKVVEASD